MEPDNYYYQFQFQNASLAHSKFCTLDKHTEHIRRMLKSILVALCCLASASAEYVVEELTEAQLRQAIEDTQKVLVVDFYAVSCCVLLHI